MALTFFFQIGNVSKSTQALKSLSFNNLACYDKSLLSKNTTRELL